MKRTAKVTLSEYLSGWGDHDIKLQIWRCNVGRISLYLLDTNISENSEDDRQLTANLYGGNEEYRLKQEIILGIGGIRALKALGIDPMVYHMNEGHSFLVGLEQNKGITC